MQAAKKVIMLLDRTVCLNSVVSQTVWWINEAGKAAGWFTAKNSWDVKTNVNL